MRNTMLLLTLLIALAGQSKAGSPTGWSPIVLPSRQYRAQIKSMPITQRPGRLLHVYGNTIRMVDQARRGNRIRPLRQILTGTDNLRSDWFNW